MKYLQRLGKSLMLPVACLPVASLLMGIGYWIDPTGWGANNVLAALLIKSGSIMIGNMALLFAIGVAVGMSTDNDGTSALAGLVSWLTITTMLSPDTLSVILKIDQANIDPSFSKIQTQFIGILAGLIGASCYNKFKNTKLPDALSFFGGKRSVAIITSIVSLFVSLILFFIWPYIYGALVILGIKIMSTGAIGAGVYGFLNRLLIPFGLHHALNSVFWFDVANINDIGKFWGTAEGGILGQTGMYMAGFFPVMMFGLPAAALAMYHCAKPNKKKETLGVMSGGALSSFFTGVTEPLEFSFMFQSPLLYLVHAILTGITVGVVAALPVRAGFNFSAGFVDWFLSFNAPFAMSPAWLLLIGIPVGIVYYVVFRFFIITFNLKTPGREDDTDETKVVLSNDDFTAVARIILEGIGGAENVTSVDNCITRLRLEIKDYTKVNEGVIKSAGVAGVIRPGKNSVQVIIGTKVQFVTDEFKALIKQSY